MSNYTTSTNFPGFSNGSLYINGAKKASTYRNPDGSVSSSYDMNEFEKKAYDYVQKSLADSIPSINTFSPSTVQDINSQVNAFKNNAVRQINETYTPMLDNLKQDIASRFGNFDNSIFLNNLNSIENKRADAINYLAQDLLSRKNELVANELNNRYNYLNFLNNYQNNAYNNILNSIASSQSNSAIGNNYNQNAYNANNQSYLYNQKINNDQNKFNQQLLTSILLSAAAI